TDYKQADIRTRHVKAQLRILVDALPQQIAFIDRGRKIRFANTAFNAGFDASADALEGRSIADVFGAAAAATLTESIDTALKGRATSCDIVIASGGRDDRAFQVSHVPHSVDDKILSFYLLMTDMTNRRTPQVDEKEEQSRLAYLYRMAMIGEMARTPAHDNDQTL